MNNPELKQRLAAILAADAVGYSRLMAVDDRATVAALDNARQVFRAHIESHHGRIIDMAGDSVLAVFDSALGAVAASLAVQADLDLQGASTPDDRRMRFRIGVHLGDVIEKADGTVYGDGVNIAARLEGLAEAGGISVSESIRSAVKGKVGAAFEDQGEQTVKNIAEPVRAYRVRAPGAASRQGGAAAPPPASAANPAAANALRRFAGGIDMALPDRPSIAVLPFDNMSGEPEQEYFTNGITEDIITELSRFRSLFVIARNSTFTYKRRSVDVRTVAEELGVRYVLVGSIRRAANRIRVTAQLIDALIGNHLWAEKYDRVLEDVFAVQEELTQAIVAAIAPHIDSSESQRVRSVRPDNLGAYELAVRGWAAAHVAFRDADRESRDRALGFAREALAIDPRSAVALRTVAFAQWQHVYFNTAVSVPEAVEDGLAAARRAIVIDHDDHVAHRWRGGLLLLCGQKAAGLADVQRAHELNPNDAMTLSMAGLFINDPQKSIDYATQALRLSPRDPARFMLLSLLGWAHFSAGDYAKGVEWSRRSVGESPSFPAAHLCLLLNLVGRADIEPAKSAFQVWRALAPEIVDARLQGKWLSADPDFVRRATAFLRIAAGLDDTGAAVTPP